jgi:ATP/maltotriose-dependent transcriptional regulator MalT
MAVSSLAARTEGWAAGLYLAAVWLRGRGGPQADVERFAGDSRHLVEYLTEVVLAQLDQDVRGFLLESSVVDRLSASLCEALTEMPAALMLQGIAGGDRKRRSSDGFTRSLRTSWPAIPGWVWSAPS